MENSFGFVIKLQIKNISPVTNVRQVLIFEKSYITNNSDGVFKSMDLLKLLEVKVTIVLMTIILTSINERDILFQTLLNYLWVSISFKKV